MNGWEINPLFHTLMVHDLPRLHQLRMAVLYRIEALCLPLYK